MLLPSTDWPHEKTVQLLVGFCNSQQPVLHIIFWQFIFQVIVIPNKDIFLRNRNLRKKSIKYNYMVRFNLLDSGPQYGGARHCLQIHSTYHS